MSGIYWLASYPKSGNTWFRAVLSNFLRSSEQPVSINDLEGGPIATDQQWFNQLTGLDAGDLLVDEIDQLRPAVYEHAAAASAEPLYLKIHDACRRLADGQWLVSARATRAAVYLVRNPLDVVVSYAHHRGITPAECVRVLNRAEATGRGRMQLKQLPCYMGSWSEHVASWLEQDLFPVLPLRYEDMLAAPERCFAEALQFLQLPHDSTRLATALRFSSLDELQRQEQVCGFDERPAASSAAFFRSGRAGGWRDVLAAADVDAIVQAHGPVMRRFGYLADDGSLL